MFFLNVRVLDKGESMVISPGKLYAYVQGEILETSGNPENPMYAALTK